MNVTIAQVTIDNMAYNNEESVESKRDSKVIRKEISLHTKHLEAKRLEHGPEVCCHDFVMKKREKKNDQYRYTLMADILMECCTELSMEKERDGWCVSSAFRLDIKQNNQSII